MQKTDIHKLCQNFSEVVRAKGIVLQEVGDRDSDAEGGYRREGTVYRLKTAEFTAELTKATRTHWNIVSDTTTNEESLTVTCGDKAVFTAYHMLGGKKDCFGPEEMFEGTVTKGPEDWKILSGTLPVKLIENYLHGQSAKAQPKAKIRRSPAAG